MTKVLDKPKRNAKGHFLPGQSGNPSGSTKKFKGMAAYIRSQTDDGRELADFALKVMRNEEQIYRHSEQWDAMKWLADRGFGKAVQTSLEVQGDVSPDEIPDLSTVTAEQLAQLDSYVGAILGAVRSQDSE